MIVLAAALAFLFLNRSSRKVGGDLSSHVSTMVATLTSLASVGGGAKAAEAYDAMKKTDTKKACLLVETANATEAQKQANGAKLRSMMKQWNETGTAAIVMVFAPWCGHCHKMMEPLGEVASDHASVAGVATCMVEGGSLTEEDMTGGKLFSIKYFPTLFVYHAGTMQEFKSPQEAAKVAVAKAGASKAEPSAPAVLATEEPSLGW